MRPTRRCSAWCSTKLSAIWLQTLRAARGLGRLPTNSSIQSSSHTSGTLNQGTGTVKRGLLSNLMKSALLLWSTLSKMTLASSIISSTLDLWPYLPAKKEFSGLCPEGHSLSALSMPIFSSNASEAWSLTLLGRVTTVPLKKSRPTKSSTPVHLQPQSVFPPP